MPVLTSTSVAGALAFLSVDNASHTALFPNPTPPLNFSCTSCSAKRTAFSSLPRVSVSGGSATRTDDGIDQSLFSNGVRQARRSADWKAAKEYAEKGLIYEGKVEGFNGGGLLIKFYSLLGFLPFPQLSPSHSCKDMCMLMERAKGGKRSSATTFDLTSVQKICALVTFSEAVNIKQKYIDTQVKFLPTIQAPGVSNEIENEEIYVTAMIDFGSCFCGINVLFYSVQGKRK